MLLKVCWKNNISNVNQKYWTWVFIQTSCSPFIFLQRMNAKKQGRGDIALGGGAWDGCSLQEGFRQPSWLEPRSTDGVSACEALHILQYSGIFLAEKMDSQLLRRCKQILPTSLDMYYHRKNWLNKFLVSDHVSCDLWVKVIIAYRLIISQSGLSNLKNAHFRLSHSRI